MQWFYSEAKPSQKENASKIIFQHQDEVGSLGKAIVMLNTFLTELSQLEGQLSSQRISSTRRFFNAPLHISLPFRWLQSVASGYHEIRPSPSSPKRSVIKDHPWWIMLFYTSSSAEMSATFRKRQHSLPRLGWFFVGSSDLLRKFTNKILFFGSHCYSSDLL